MSDVAKKPEPKKIPRPLPKPGVYMDTRPFWDAAHQGKLVVQYCKDSGRAQFFPRPVSMVNGRRNLEWREVSGRGTVYSFTNTYSATPEREALICGALRLSFAQLDTRSDQLAAALHARGVGVGDRVAVLLPNCAEYVLAFLAILKVGAIAVPIGTRLTPSEASFILADCAPRAMFIHPETRSWQVKHKGKS